jgi:hypothetical protein
VRVVDRRIVISDSFSSMGTKKSRKKRRKNQIASRVHDDLDV